MIAYIKYMFSFQTLLHLHSLMRFKSGTPAGGNVVPREEYKNHWVFIFATLQPQIVIS
jgi:hypothetical protein